MFTNDRLLPPEFSDLEPFAANWALSSFDARMQHRAASSMNEIRRFYDAAQPRADAAMIYLEQFPLHQMPQDATCLLRLMYGLAQAAMAVEVHGQPHLLHATLPILVSVKREPSPA